jgi:hypothetical protein
VDSRGDIYVGEVATTFAKCDRGVRDVIKFVKKKYGKRSRKP